MRFHKDFYRGNGGFFGQFGLRVLTSAQPSDPEEYFYAILVLTDAVITADIEIDGFEDGNYWGDQQLTSLAVPSGFYIFGRFRNINLASGSVIGYLGKVEQNAP